MTIISRRDIHLALIREVASGKDEDEAVAAISDLYCIPEEAVREVVAELMGEGV